MKALLKNKKAKKVLNILVDIAMVLILINSIRTTWTGEFSWYYALSVVVLVSGTIGTLATAYRWRWAGIPNAIQNISNLWVSWKSRIFGDSLMSLWYLVNELYSVYGWNKKDNIEEDNHQAIKTEKKVNWWYVIVAILVTGFGLGFVSFKLGGQQIFLDAVNNSSGAVAQYMQKVQRKSASWWLWMITNLIGVVMWWRINKIQSFMYIIFLINSIRGLINWSEE